MRIATALSSLLLALLICSPAGAGSLTAEDAVWKELPVAKTGPETRELQSQLAWEVQKMIAAGHLAPGYFNKGLGSTATGDWLWSSPAEEVYTLSLALPYLPEEMKPKTIAYMQAEMQKTDPLQKAFFDYNESDVRREPFPMPPDRLKPNLGWPPARVGLAELYMVWLYARNSGDWTYLEKNWGAIQKIYGTELSRKAKEKTPAVRYPEIGGLIGFARIARKLGHEDLAKQAADTAVAWLGQAHFQEILDREYAPFKNAMGHPTKAHMPQFMIDPARRAAPICFFPREVGLYLAGQEQEKKAVAAHLDWREKVQPLWFVTYGFSIFEGEISHYTPDLPWALFMLRAYALGESREDLVDRLSFPSMTGDLYHIQKLVAAIEAPEFAKP